MIYKHKIILKDIKTNIHIGVTDAEREKKQEILITVEIVPHIDNPPEKDSIDETINYSEIRDIVLKVSNSKSYNLLETLCWTIAKILKDKFNLEEVSVIVKKFPYKDVSYVSYSITL